MLPRLSLGSVEIGGWRKFGHDNPPAAELPEEVRRNVEFALLQASVMPLLEVEEVEVEVEALGGGVHGLRRRWRTSAGGRGAAPERGRGAARGGDTVIGAGRRNIEKGEV